MSFCFLTLERFQSPSPSGSNPETFQGLWLVKPYILSAVRVKNPLQMSSKLNNEHQQIHGKHPLVSIDWKKMEKESVPQMLETSVSMSGFSLMF